MIRNDEPHSSDAKHWTTLKKSIALLRNHNEAISLVSSGPRQGEPGRVLYSNFGFFLQEYRAPAGASLEELEAYLDFLKRQVRAGAVKAEVATSLVNALESEIELS